MGMIAILLAASLFCGDGRVDIRHGTDSGAARIRLEPIRVRIDWLAEALPKTAKESRGYSVWYPSAKFEDGSFEFSVYETTGVCVAIRKSREPNVHFVLRERDGKATIVAEGVHPQCSTTSPLVHEVILSRLSLIRTLKHFYKNQAEESIDVEKLKANFLGKIVTVRGVGYVGHNEIGLSPITSFKVDYP
jgi:hypothetical protein